MADLCWWGGDLVSVGGFTLTRWKTDGRSDKTVLSGRWGEPAPHRVITAPDDSHVVVTTGGGQVLRVDRSRVEAIEQHGIPQVGAAFLPDGRLATVGTFRGLQRFGPTEVWPEITGVQLGWAPDGLWVGEPGKSCRKVRDGVVVTEASPARRLGGWRAGVEIRVQPDGAWVDGRHYPAKDATCVDLALDGRVAVGTRSGRIEIFDGPRHHVLGDNSPIVAVAFEPVSDGLLATANASGRVLRWNAVGLTAGHAGRVIAVCHCGDRIATASTDQVRIWDAEGDAVAVLGFAAVRALAFDGQAVLVGHGNGLTWLDADGVVVRERDPGPVRSVGVLATGEVVYKARGVELLDVDGRSREIVDVANDVATDGQSTIFVVHHDRVSQWAPVDSAIVEHSQYGVTAVSAARHRLATVDRRYARLWDLRERQSLMDLLGESPYLRQFDDRFVALSPDGEWLVGARRDEIRVRDIGGGVERSFHAPADVHALHVSDDGVLIAGLADGTAARWTL